MIFKTPLFKALEKLSSAFLQNNVTFSYEKPFFNFDDRRNMKGLILNKNFPFKVRQIKYIKFSRAAVSQNLVVGNHKHQKKSGQWEAILVLGEKKISYFEFRYRNYIAPVKSKNLKGGDLVLIPPGCSLALMPKVIGASIIEISNKEHNKFNYEKDFLF